ncbi:penicillin-binding transpeptidase domain-containing protein [Amphibacillus indicireducens]|uniref:serine-type D-Ala-D-Ala carboxypeptidase n=1 Tax=Amphibacillus indicireducens TaxID=1076330 RepID=A0ABP7VQB2_9BACI
MKKLTYLIIGLSVMFMLVSCAEDEEAEVILPEERFEAYVELWQDYDFDQMYDMLSEETKATYSREEFVDRYQKIYQDLEIDELVIEYTLPEHPEPLDGEEIVYPTTFPFTVQQQSIVNEIKFTAEITMVERIIPVDEEETISDWDVEWHPGLIFPELANGGTITLVSTPTTRGEIFDRNGKGLAVTDKVYEIGVDPGRFTENRDAEIEELAGLLDMSVGAIESTLGQGWVADGMFVPLKTVPADDDDYIADLMAIPPVIAQSQTGRSYPYGESLAHLIGYVGQINEEELENDEDGVYSQTDLIGKRGIEQLFEARLRGEAGIRIIVESETSKIGIAEKPPVPGEDIHLTIDAELQEMIFQAYDGDAGTAAAIDPHSGETLALVSSPSFDPHDFTYGISQAKYNDLVENPDQPILNRFASTYSPGSAFKPITAMVGLKDGAITQEDRIEINGLTWSRDGWGNYQVRRVSESDGPVDLKDALIRSDNIYFAQKAVEIGGDQFTSGLEALGFGQGGLDFAYPIYSSQVSNSGEIDRETLLADSGYGQGEILITALHLATAYTPILNDGTMVQPILETNQELGQSFADDLISANDAAYLRDALRQVVAGPRGTARKANIDAIALSGKTGTAELKQSIDDEHAQENGWFVAYPDSHDIIIAMMVENIEGRGGSGYVVEKLTSIYQDLYQ